MKKIIFAFVFFTSSAFCTYYFESIYPSATQELVDTISSSPREKEFAAVLSDGSVWDVSPGTAKRYETWKHGEKVHIKARTFKIFNRKFPLILYNQDRNEGVEVKMIHPRTDPEPLCIAAIEEIPIYYEVPEVVTEYYYDYNTDSWGATTIYTGRMITVLDRIDKYFVLSDCSTWYIRNSRYNYYVGEPVYIGAQGKGKKKFDFVFVSCDLTKTYWEWAKPPRR